MTSTPSKPEASLRELLQMLECGDLSPAEQMQLAEALSARDEADGEDRARKLYEPDEYEDAFKGRATTPASGEAETLARLFHDTYERLAPSFGYETRKDTRAFDPTSANGRLMIAAVPIIRRLAAVAPAGMVLVPREPTEAMLSAADRAVNSATYEVYPEEIRVAWNAMLAAAPTPPATAGKEDGHAA